MQVFRARVKNDPDNISGFPAYVDLRRIKPNMTLAEAQSIRVYDTKTKENEYARQISSVKKMYIKLTGNASDVFIFIDGKSSDYSNTYRKGAKNVWSSWGVVPQRLVDAKGNHTIEQVGNVSFAEGLLGDAYLLSGEGTNNYPKIKLNRPETTLNFTNKLSVVAVMKRTNNLAFSSLISSGESYDTGNGFDFYKLSTDHWYTDKPSTDSEWIQITDTKQPITDYVVVHISKSNNQIVATFDGVSHTPINESGVFKNIDDIRIGGSFYGASGWKGTIEELRIGKNVFSQAWKEAEHRNLKDQSAFWGEWDDITNTHIDGLTGERFDSERAYLEHTNKVTGVKPTDLHHHGSIGVTVAEGGLKRTGHLNEDKQALIATARNKVIEHDVDRKRAKFLSKIARRDYVEI